ncbi:hypothetical protein [Paenibacillus thalictri]|uniref:hypothetical protein n=1 Tax=Paenibacillus thalictri TaxID=2527873 RepID=UPI00103406AC|nr:hypothetical protein [Paenibacillus thalictri]
MNSIGGCAVQRLGRRPHCTGNCAGCRLGPLLDRHGQLHGMPVRTAAASVRAAPLCIGVRMDVTSSGCLAR